MKNESVEGPPRPDDKFVRRLDDGKVLLVIAEHEEEICVEEMFDFADGGRRPLRLWHSKSRYETANG